MGGGGVGGWGLGNFEFASFLRKFSKMMAKSEESSVKQKLRYRTQHCDTICPPPPLINKLGKSPPGGVQVNTKEASNSINTQKNPEKHPRKV